MQRPFLAVVLMAAASAAAAAQQTARPAPLTAAEVVSRVRASVRYDRLRSQAPGLAGEGTARTNGVDAGYRLAFAPDGRFMSSIDGPLGSTTMFDGERGWAVDWSGMPRPIQLEELDEEKLAAWVYTGRWLAEDGPFEVALAESRSDGSRVALALTLGPGRPSATLYVDRATWQPVSLVRSSDSGEEVFTFEDYRDAAGARFPFRFTHTLGEVSDRFQLRSLAPADTASAYTPPFARPADTTFRASAAPEVETRRARTGHLLVHPRVEGKDLGWFIFDSGAGAMVIDKGAADRARMPALGEVHVNGVGGSTTGRFRMGGVFEIGPLAIEKVRWVELDLGFLADVFGVPVGGIVGFDLFARAVVEFDVAAPSVRLHDSSAYRLTSGVWQEIAFTDKHPAVMTRFEGGREGIFRLDTGSDQTVTFHAPAVERFGLLKGRKTTATRSGGVGGATATRSGRLEWFDLGGHRFENPEVEFATARKGAFADDYLVGNVGTGFLRAFTIVFDYPNRRIAFVRKTEDRSQKSEDRSQKSEVRSQKSNHE